MSGRLDNTVAGLGQIVESQSWTDVENATDRFMTSVNGLLGRIDQTALDTTERTGQIQSQIDSWIDSGKTLAEHLGDEFNKNTEQMIHLAALSRYR